MTKPFKTLKERMTAEARARARKRAEELLAEERTVASKRLLDEMEASFANTQERARRESEGAPATSDEELETLVADAIRSARRGARNSSKRKPSRQ